MNINYLHRQLKKRKEFKHFEMKPIGSALRLRRKEMKMTLEEGAEDICSISYLSKLENNLIEPNSEFVDQLMVRYQMKEIIHYDTSLYESDLNILIDHKVRQTKPSVTISTNYMNREDHQARLIRLVEASLSFNHQIVFSEYEVIQQFITHLKHEELCILLVSLAEALYEEERYHDAYRVISEISHFNFNQFDLRILVWRIKLMISLRMRKTAEVLKFFHLYISEVEMHSYYHLSKEMKKHYLLYLSFQQTPNETLKLMKLYDPYDELEQLPYVNSCFVHQNYLRVIELAKDRVDLNGWLFVYLVSLEETNQVELLKHVILQSDDQKLKVSDETIVYHMKMKYLTDLRHVLHYIRRDLIGMRVQSEDPLLLEYLMMDGAKIFSKAQFYKEASHLLTHYHPIIKSLQLAYTYHEDEE